MLMEGLTDRKAKNRTPPKTMWVFFAFDLIFYIPVNNFSVMSDRTFVCGTSTKQGLMCLAKGQNPVMSVRLKPATPRSRVKHSTTEPLSSLKLCFVGEI